MNTDAICGSQCPKHDHICLRSPQHQAGICRDEKQKGTESCTWDPRVVRPAVRNLVRALRFYADPAKSCWIVPSPGQYALIVPALYGAMSFQRGYRRATVEEAERRGLVRLGSESELVPVFDYEPAWLKSAVPHPVEGRTITAGGAL